MTRFLRPCAFLFLATALALSLSACDSGGANDPDPDPEPQEQNEAPSASASASATSVAIATEVTLDASGSSDPDGDDLSFAWTLDAPSGSEATLSDDTAEQPTFAPDVEGTYTATVTVDDGNDATDDASVTVTAEASGGSGAGNAEVTFSGAVDNAFDGYAYFYEDTDPDTGEEIFFIFLTNSDAETLDSDAAHVWIARQSSRPSEGEFSFLPFDSIGDYELNSDTFISFAFANEANADGYDSYYYADGGALTITQSSDDQVTGTIDTDAVGLRFTEAGEETFNVAIEGTFTAVPLDSYLTPMPN